MRNILIEANCIYNIDKKDDDLVPNCCMLGPNNVSINCFKYNKDKNKYCPFLVFGTAKTTIVLTDEYGNVINSDGFWGDLKLSEEEWRRKEKEWIDKQNAYLSK